MRHSVTCSLLLVGCWAIACGSSDDSTPPEMVDASADVADGRAVIDADSSVEVRDVSQEAAIDGAGGGMDVSVERTPEAASAEASGDAAVDAPDAPDAPEAGQTADATDGGAVDGGTLDATPDAPLEANAISEASADAPADAVSDTAITTADGGDASDGAAEASASTDAASCEAGTTGSRIQIVFNTVNTERVTSLRWLDSSNTLSPNFVGEGGSYCGDPTETFGQAYGAPEGNGPYPIGGGTRSTRTDCGMDVTLVTLPKNCNNDNQLPVTTEYHFYDGAHANQVRITRTFGFDQTTTAFTGIGIRPYVPRMLLAQFTTTIYPKQSGTAVNSQSAYGCGGDCITTTGTNWSGKWFADVDPTSGRAMIVLRDPAMTSAVSLTVNNDGNSSSNLSSFVLMQPGGGWQAPVTEVEYLCFEDLTSWPQTQRDAATLPANCGPL